MASIAKRPNGTWRARYRAPDGREHARHFSRKVDAQRWLDESTAALVTGQYVDPRAGRETFGAFYAAWSERQVWVDGTRRAAGQAARSTTFREEPLKAVRRSHVEQWVKSLASSGLAPTTIRSRFNYVRAVFRGAVKDRLIAENPCDGVTLPRVRKAGAAMVIPTPAQVGALLGGADAPFAAFLALAAFAGLRLGEIIGVQVGDVGFLARTLDVRRQVQRESGSTPDVRPPKYGSERPVHLPDDLVTVLARHVERLADVEPSRWLFAGADGGPINPNAVRRSMDRARAASGVAVKLHDLRHFYASGLIAAGCDVVTVQRALGHASATVTLNTYAHLWPTAEDRTRNAAAGLMAAALHSADSPRTQEG